ncbi:MAG: hypothetical protein EOO88_24835 [Pedobacter sp.]|nr:MAG: hypothetical protein EOO88_24835 [Pedobacter sp.]
MPRVGIYGVGHLGKFHLNNWKEIPGVELVGFFDPHDDTAKEVSEKYQLVRFLDADSLMDACDAIDSQNNGTHCYSGSWIGSSVG